MIRTSLALSIAALAAALAGSSLIAGGLMVAALILAAYCGFTSRSIEEERPKDMRVQHQYEIDLEHHVKVDVGISAPKDGFRSRPHFYPWENN